MKKEQEDSPNLWLVTFVTHNSRVSERMVTYGVKRGEPVIFNTHKRKIIAEKIQEASINHEISIDIFAILPDHVHMIIRALDIEDLRAKVQKIKGYSSHSYQRATDWEEGGHIWAQKFHYKLIENENQLAEMFNYLENNHLKHAEQWDLDDEDRVVGLGQEKN